MNLLIIVSDTFRWDYLGAYGNDWIATPNLDVLAAESVLFSQAYAEGPPTLPARRVIKTGRNVFPFSYRPQASDMVQLEGWHPLFAEDTTLAEHLRG
ncbi:MAG: sulfatase-like hydrolase/transferase [Armatimonadota bacterium]